MTLRRQEKLSELYRRASNDFLHDNISLENGIFSVTNVELSEKLNRLKIYFSVWPDQKEADVIKSLKILKRDLRKELASKINTKFSPEVEFVLDESEKKRLRIEELLKKGK